MRVNENARRALVLALIAACTSLALASSGSVRVDVLRDDPASIVLRYVIDEARRTEVLIDGERYEELSLEGEPRWSEVGSPALPRINRSVIIPGDRRMGIRVLSARSHDEPAHIAPSKGHLSRKVDPESVPYTFGPAYEVSAHFPGPLASLGSPYIMRDHRGAVVQINPFQYNHRTGTLRVYEEIVVEIFDSGPGGPNQLGAAARARVRPFEEIYRSHFLNAGPAPEAPERGDDYDPIDEEGDMLVICHDPWMDNMTPFVDHKNGIGIPTTIVRVSEIGNDAGLIKDYIQDVYDTSDLAFVLLVGDAEHVDTPIVGVGGENGASDPSYAKLAGDDDYPEILVGRFSAQSAADVDTMVERSVDYETLPATEQPWFKRGTGIASDEGGGGQGDEGQSDREHLDEIRGWLLDDGYTEVDQIYDPGARDDDVSDALNAGRGIVNYTGHGSATSWGTTGFNVSDVNALVNDDMLPFIVSVACNNGEFHHYETCFGEAWLRATHEGVPTGAIATYMSSVSQSWSPPMEGQDEFNLLLTDPLRPYETFGALCFAGSSSMMDEYGNAGREMFDTWIVFGDPSIQVVGVAQPASGMRVTPTDGFVSEGAPGGPFNSEERSYTVENLNETPLDFSVGCEAAWIELSTEGGTLEGGESTIVVVSLGDAAYNLDVGYHGTTVEFTNESTHEGDTTRSVTLDVSSTVPAVREMLDENPLWQVEGEWAFGTPTGQGGGYISNPDPTGGATGSHVYGVNLDGNFSGSAGGPFYLTSAAFDLSDLSGSALSFQRWLNTAGLPYVRSTVEISSDAGASWSQLWTTSENVLDADWTPQSFDVSALADGQSDVRVRWSYSVETPAPLVGSGWNVDDIEIRGNAGSARIVLELSGEILSWNDVTGAIGYDVVRGDLELLVESGGDFTAATEECVADDEPSTQLEDETEPDPGEGHWLLVRAVTPDGPMTWQPLAGSSQVGLRDAEIDAAPGTCP